MIGTQQTILYAILMVAAGQGIPAFAALNGGLATRLQNSMLASNVALLAAMVVILATQFLTAGPPRFVSNGSIPLRYIVGGIFVAIYILGMTWIAPRFGVSKAIAFVLLGQLISMALIDHFGWFGAAYHAVTPQRLLDLALMTAGVFLAVSGNQQSWSLRPPSRNPLPTFAVLNREARRAFRPSFAGTL